MESVIEACAQQMLKKYLLNGINEQLLGQRPV